MDSYECMPDPGDDWIPTSKQLRLQREREDMRQHAARMASLAPPLSEATVQRLVALLSQQPSANEMVEWRLRLFCGHVITRMAHRTHKSVHAAFTAAISCAECGLDPATIVAAEAVCRLQPDSTGGPLVVEP